jgi:hypothetical protein
MMYDETVAGALFADANNAARAGVTLRFTPSSHRFF